MKKGFVFSIGFVLVSLFMINFISAEGWTQVWAMEGNALCNEFGDAWQDGDGVFLVSGNYDHDGLDNPRSGFSNVVDCGIGPNGKKGIYLNSDSGNYPNFFVDGAWVRINPSTRFTVDFAIDDATSCAVILMLNNGFSMYAPSEYCNGNDACAAAWGPGFTDYWDETNGLTWEDAHHIIFETAGKRDRVYLDNLGYKQKVNPVEYPPELLISRAKKHIIGEVPRLPGEFDEDFCTDGYPTMFISKIKYECFVSAEVCDGLDNDCDGDVDEGCSESACNAKSDDGDDIIDEGCDDDLDSYIDKDLTCSGNPYCTTSVHPDGANYFIQPDTIEGGWCHDCSEENEDCLDDPYNYGTFVNPGLTETCDGLDNDCDGDVDEGCDSDQDGYLDPNMECREEGDSYTNTFDGLTGTWGFNPLCVNDYDGDGDPALAIIWPKNGYWLDYDGDGEQNYLEGDCNGCSLLDDNDEVPYTESEAYWTNLNLEDITAVDKGDTVLMILEEEGDSGTRSYKVYKDSTIDSKVDESSSSNYGIYIAEDGEGNFYFKVKTSSVDAKSNNLGVSNSENNSMPEAVIAYLSDNTCSVNNSINFLQRSTDEDDLLKITWDFKDGTIDTTEDYSTTIDRFKADLSHTYTSAGVYNVELTASEMNRNQEDTAYKTMYILQEGINVVPVITKPENGVTNDGNIVEFDASQSYVADCSKTNSGSSDFSVCDLYCDYLHSPGQTTTSGYDLEVEWTVHPSGEEQTEIITGDWTVNYTSAVQFYKFFQYAGEHSANLKLTYTP